MAYNTHLDISEHCKHIVSLDSLDLGLLPITYKPSLSDNTAFLWTRINDDAEKYFEFEVKLRPVSDLMDVEGPSTKHFKDTICHICNINVPNDFYLKHLHSSKHKSFQKIADIAQERVRKQEKLVLKGNSDQLGHFCESCVLVMPLSELSDHAQTTTHKNSAEMDKFLNKFASFYSNNGEIDLKEGENIIDEDFNKDVVHRSINEMSKRIEDFEIVPIKVNSGSIPTHNNDEKCKEKDKTLFESKIKDTEVLLNNIKTHLDTQKEINNNVIENNDGNEEANVVGNLEQYIRLLKRRSTIKLSIVNANDQDRVIIETAGGVDLIISVNNFHGFKRTGNKFLQCKLCKVFVSNVDDHKVAENHIKIVSQPLKDKHCLRHLTNSRSHCIVCNEIIDNPEVHKLFNEHIRKVEQAVIPKLTLKPTELNNEDNSDVVQKSNVIKPNIIPFDTGSNAVIESKKLIDAGHNGIENRISSSIVPETEKVTKIAKDDSYFCGLCSKMMHINNIESHLNGTKHIFNSKTVNNYLMRKERNGLKCKVCDTNVPIFVWAIEDHIASVDHVIAYFKVLESNKIDKIGDNFFCKPCSETMVKMSEIHHIETKSHKIKLAAYNISYIASMEQSKLYKGLDKLCDDFKNGGGEKSGNLRSDFDKANIKNDVVKDTVDINEGVLKNRNRNELIGNINDDKHKTDTDGIIDEKCKNLIKNQQNIDHIPLRPYDGHSKNFFNPPDIKKIQDEVAKHKTIDEIISRVNNSLETLLKYFDDESEIHSHLERTNTENEVKCKICENTIKVENADKHINSIKHVRNYRRLMEINKLKLRENRFVCYACNVYVENDNELRHIGSEKHVKRIEALKNCHYVLVTADDRKLIDIIDKDLNFIEHRKEGSEAKGTEFGDFITWKRREYMSNIKNHYIKLVGNEHKLFCVLCHVLIQNNNHEITSHANDKNHIVKYEGILSHNQIFEIDGGYVCGYCECVIDNEFDHIAGQKHGENRKVYRNKNFCFKCNVSTLKLGVKEHVTSIEHIKTVIGGTPAHYYCNICDLQLSNNKINIQRHTDGFQHKNNCSLLEQNKVLLKNKRCFCEICESHFSRKYFEDHISSLNHLMLRGDE